MIVELTKIGSMIVMFAMIIVFGSLPLRSKSFKENKKLLSYSNAFSGIAINLIIQADYF